MSATPRERYRNPRTGRFERDPLFSPIPPEGVDEQSTPIWDTVADDLTPEGIHLKPGAVYTAPVRRPILRSPITPDEPALVETRREIPLLAAAGYLVMLLGLAIGLWALAAGGGGATVGLLAWALAVFVLGPSLVRLARDRHPAGRNRGEVS